MIPFGSDTVTLYHDTGNGWARTTLTGCSWRESYGRTLYDNTMRISGSTVCTCRYVDGPKAVPGDVFIRGEVFDAIGSGTEIPALMQRYAESGAFLCESFTDNHQGQVPLKHYCARGQAYVL